MTDYQAIIASPIGNLGIYIENDKLVKIDYLSNNSSLKKPTLISAKKIVADLKYYFKTPTHPFTLSLALSGTKFQQQVLKELLNIPVGETRSYGDIAKKLNTSPRAVGNACRRNPIPIVIPCHRVTAKNHIGGYSGDITGKKIAIKNWLLCHEKNIFMDVM